jgi:ABC-type dipeptide/oligopeptide/nickel transport system permease component
MWKAWSFVIGLIIGAWMWFTGTNIPDLLALVILLIAVPLFWAAAEMVVLVLHSITH